MAEAIGRDESFELAFLTKKALKESYLADGRPWVVAYSGGKDSTLVLQLVYEVLVELGREAVKPVYIVSSDTQVEAPNIVDYIGTVLKAVLADARKRKIPLTYEIVRPIISETFWSKLIGRGYPPPTRWFRWCTTNMKIKPSRRAIDKITAEHGSVILLLGSRTAESSQRRKGMESRVKNFRNLNAHHEIPNSFVLAPIASWSDDEVWDYLFSNNPAPWNHTHDQMIGLYRQAVGGECPVVMDLSTPSCGGGRFGCWTCTVVKMDKSMEGFIQTGDEWMQPLADFRTWLKEYRERPDVRMERRRDGTEGPGPFTPAARKEVLARLFEQECAVGIQLISDDEIIFIQSAWSSEFDLNDSAIAVAAKYGRSVQRGTPMPLNDNEQSLLEDIAAEHGLNPDIVAKVLALETEFPNLDRWGARPDLRRKLSDLISVAESNEASTA
ncbi:MAG: DNA phosphorothioation system sulfurtransferase DndC [Gammaproteobacteria bacterium]|nr:DNA phosphorothioation system sulfurtransferase DndC [Gammaproteobacteria bacterium]